MALPGFKVVTLTDAAANRVKDIIGKADRPIVGVRVGVKNGGCAGMSYTMEYAESRNPLDEVVEDKGVKVLIDPKAVLFLLGTEMDFQTTKLSSQFVFNNPNQTSACGCGESVAITPATPETLAKALSRSTLMYLTVFGPIIRLFDRTAAGLLRRLGIEPIEELPEGATSEDLEQIIRESRANGGLDAELSTLLDRGLDFRGRTAAEAMIPRVDVHTVPATATAADVVALLDTHRSRFPVRGEELDEIVGVVGIADILAIAPAERAAVPVSSVMSAPVLVPSSLRLPAVLERLRAAHRQLACVVDEFGGFAGIITLEDIAEELVGQIRDEDDEAEPAPVRQPDGSWLVPARWRIDEITDATGVDLPVGDDYETVSGLVLSRLGRVAQAGDSVTLDNGSLSVRVESVDRHVPLTVRISR